MNEHVQKIKRAYPTAGMSTCKRKHKSTAGTGRGPEQGQDENQNKFKMSVGMKIASCANNTNDKNFTTMTVNDIRSRLDKILATGFDVMCGCSVQEGKLVFRKEVDEELRGQC